MKAKLYVPSACTGDKIIFYSTRGHNKTHRCFRRFTTENIILHTKSKNLSSALAEMLLLGFHDSYVGDNEPALIHHPYWVQKAFADTVSPGQP